LSQTIRQTSKDTVNVHDATPPNILQTETPFSSFSSDIASH